MADACLRAIWRMSMGAGQCRRAKGTLLTEGRHGGHETALDQWTRDAKQIKGAGAKRNRKATSSATAGSPRLFCPVSSRLHQTEGRACITAVLLGLSMIFAGLSRQKAAVGIIRCPDYRHQKMHRTADDGMTPVHRRCTIRPGIEPRALKVLVSDAISTNCENKRIYRNRWK